MEMEKIQENPKSSREKPNKHEEWKEISSLTQTKIF